MNKKLIDNLLKNWPAKVICFTIAIFLYLFYQASLIEKKTFTVPLEVIEQGLVIHVEDLPAAVVVVVRSNETDIKSIFATDIKASINLNNIVESGTYKVPINVTISDKLMGFDPLEIKLKEEKIKVSVERKISKFVKIVPSIVGEVADKYEIKSIEMTPPFIQIEGPESLVNSINEVTTGRVNVSNAKISFAVDTGINDICDLVNIIGNKSCKATISVIPKRIEKDFENIPVRISNLPDEFKIKSILPVYNIKLKGSISDINKFNILKYPIKVDLSGVVKPGEYEIPVSLDIPEELEIIENSGDNIFITIVEKEKKLPEVIQPDSDKKEDDKDNKKQEENSEKTVIKDASKDKV